MSNKIITRYSQIHQFEPLLLRQKLDVLHAQSQEIADKSARLAVPALLVQLPSALKKATLALPLAHCYVTWMQSLQA